MEIDNSYKGREHSLIKHELLKGYLEKLLFIVARGGVKEITYIDCFAGPWGDQSEELKGTSIAISLEILSKVQNAIAAPPHNIVGTKFRAVYIEETMKRYKKLVNYLDKKCPSGIECYHFNDDYSNVQDEILEKCGNGFAFFFVDPKGWADVSVPKMQKLLEQQNSEFLIIFMYDFLNRAIGMDALREQICALLGRLDDEDIAELSEMDSKDRENYVVRLYRNALKESIASNGVSKKWTYHATVLDKDKERTKYHMVYMTGHPKGIIEFSRLSEKVDIFQVKVRSQTKFDQKEEDTGITDMFGLDSDNIKDKESVDIIEVKKYWFSKLEIDPKAFSEVDLADMLEETGYLESDLQNAFGELLKEVKVENIDMRNNRRIKRYVHFDKRERLRRCV